MKGHIVTYIRSYECVTRLGSYECMYTSLYIHDHTFTYTRRCEYICTLKCIYINIYIWSHNIFFTYSKSISMPFSATVRIRFLWLDLNSSMDKLMLENILVITPKRKLHVLTSRGVIVSTGITSCMRPANENRRYIYSNVASHWLGA